jgi:hypothetical protein
MSPAPQPQNPEGYQRGSSDRLGRGEKGQWLSLGDLEEYHGDGGYLEVRSVCSGLMSTDRVCSEKQ